MPAAHARRRAVLAVALALLTAACAGDGVGSGTPTDEATAEPGTASNAASASTSGSPTPEATPLIEGGRNFAFIKRVDPSADPATVTFDLAYFLTGDEAIRAAEDRGDEVPPPNDYYVINDNPRLRTVPLAPNAELVLLDWNDCCETTFDGELTDFARAFDEGQITVDGHRYNGNLSPYWLTARDGVIVRIEEQYIP